jgi:ankyrin repeat protein
MIDENMPETEYRDFLFACERGDLDKVKYFVEKYDCANGFLQKGDWVTRPLIKASVEQKKVVVEYLISKGADVNEYQLSGSNRIRVPLLSKLIIAEAEYVGGEWEVDSFESATKLLKKRKMVQLFIDNGADINKPDEDGYTPLDRSVSAINYPAQKLLSSLGAKHGKRYLIDEKEKNYSQFDDYIDAPYFIKKDTEFHTEIDREIRSSKMFNEELDIGFLPNKIERCPNDINEKNEFGETPVDYAIKLGHTKAVKFLRENGGKTSKELEDESKS